MQVSNNPKKEGSFKDSPFPWRERPYTDETYDGKEVIISKGSSIPEVLRQIYGPIGVHGIKANFPFLDRDSTPKSYDPAKEDPFIMPNSGAGSVKNDMLAVISEFTELGRMLGLPIIKDKDRGVDMIDFEGITDKWLNSDVELDSHSFNGLALILSNVDIIRKFSIVRSSIPGWWMASYARKDAADPSEFIPAIDIITKAEKKLRSNTLFKKVVAEVIAGQGDPLDSNNGYPYFESDVDENGSPIAKIKVIHRYKGLAQFMTGDVNKLLREVDERCPVPGLRGFPFAIAPLRRLQPGYKWAHTYTQSMNGLRSDYDLRGNCSIRIAWMASYILNLILSPVQSVWKAQRIVTPGCYHAALQKKYRRAYATTGKKIFTVEADYTNYDRYLPINVFQMWTERFMREVAGTSQLSSMRTMYQGLFGVLHRQMPIIIPDRFSPLRGRGWVCTPKKIGLLSGLKITSEEGTKINEIMNVQSLLNSGVYSAAAISELYEEYHHDLLLDRTPQTIEPFLIQSDDTLLQSTSQSNLKKMTRSFKELTTRAGLKGSALLGSRMLMRDVTDHKDSPVPARVYQNTVSNEDSVLCFAKFYIGLSTRCDGLLGMRLQDPFGLGPIEAISVLEAKIVHIIMSHLLGIFKAARTPHIPSIDIASLYTNEAARMIASWEAQNGPLRHSNLRAASMPSVKPSMDTYTTLKNHLLKAGALMAQEDTQTDSLSTLIAALKKSEHVPSVRMFLDQLLLLRPEFKAILDSLLGKEHSFYILAMKQLGLNPDMLYGTHT